MSPEVFWSLTADEFTVLKEQHEAPLRRWAMQMAADYNRTYDTQGLPWIPADFLDPASRDKRAAEHAKGQRAVARLTMELQRMRPGVEPDGLPEWAKVN